MAEYWKMKPLDQWSIVGMNHYHVNGERKLFVAMTKDGHCITEEGADNEYLWNRLCHKAWDAEKRKNQPRPIGLSDEQVQSIMEMKK